MSRGLRFTKGEGTGNDFVLLPDPEGDLELTPDLVRKICDRRFGIGADGVLRVVRSERAAAAPDVDVTARTGDPEWFMDYRNADGTTAEMCGNGIRVFARFLVDRGYAGPGRLEVLTRGGVRVLDVPPRGDIAVDMGPPGYDADVAPQIELAGVRYPAAAVDMPNPHAVVWLPALAVLPAPPLPTPTVSAEDFPEGANVEFVETVSSTPPRVRMRVHERGAGETLSCGTGACAVAVVAAGRLGVPAGEPIVVEVPGGALTVEVTAAGSVRMTGPAVLVADGEFASDWSARG